eukprot:jgi/Mesvir1/22790/Mv14178-RA.1
MDPRIHQQAPPQSFLSWSVAEAEESDGVETAELDEPPPPSHLSHPWGRNSWADYAEYDEADALTDRMDGLVLHEEHLSSAISWHPSDVDGASNGGHAMPHASARPPPSSSSSGSDREGWRGHRSTNGGAQVYQHRYGAANGTQAPPDTNGGQWDGPAPVLTAPGQGREPAQVSEALGAWDDSSGAGGATVDDWTSALPSRPLYSNDEWWTGPDDATSASPGTGAQSHALLPVHESWYGQGAVPNRNARPAGLGRGVRGVAAAGTRSAFAAGSAPRLSAGWQQVADAGFSLAGPRAGSAQAHGNVAGGSRSGRGGVGRGSQLPRQQAQDRRRYRDGLRGGERGAEAGRRGRDERRANDEARRQGYVTVHVDKVPREISALDLAAFLLDKLVKNGHDVCDNPLRTVELETDRGGRPNGKAWLTLQHSVFRQLQRFELASSLVMNGKALQLQEDPRKLINSATGDRRKPRGGPITLRCSVLRLCVPGVAGDGGSTSGGAPSTLPPLQVLWEQRGEPALVIFNWRKRRVEIYLQLPGRDEREPFRVSLAMTELDPGCVRTVAAPGAVGGWAGGSSSLSPEGMVMVSVLLAVRQAPKLARGELKPRSPEVRVRDLLRAGGPGQYRWPEFSEGGGDPSGDSDQELGSLLNDRDRQPWEWTRTVDPTQPEGREAAGDRVCQHSVFSEATVYVLELGPVHGNVAVDLRKMMGEQNLIHNKWQHAIQRDALAWPELRRSSLNEYLQPYRDAQASFSALPFSVRYLVEVLLSESKLLHSHVTEGFVAMLASVPEGRAEWALSKAEAHRLYRTTMWEDPDATLRFLRRCLLGDEQALEERGGIRSRRAAEGRKVHLVMVRKVLVTPLRITCLPPMVEVSNRVLREYPEHADSFLRVQVLDEDMDKFAGPANSGRVAADRDTRDLLGRVARVLRHGIMVGGHHFGFLAYSSSQLHECSLWMYTEAPLPPPSPPPPSPAEIRRFMGRMDDIKCVGRHASRLGQCLSTSLQTLEVPPAQRGDIADVCVGNNLFSDGVGIISQACADEVAASLGLDVTPSAFQIRYGGVKGMLAAWGANLARLSPDVALAMAGKKVLVRPSMDKFKCDHTMLEIVGISKYMPCYLNHQIIAILSSLGVLDKSFLDLQTQALNAMRALFKDEQHALEIVRTRFPVIAVGHHRGRPRKGGDLPVGGDLLVDPLRPTAVVLEMLRAGFAIEREPHLHGLLRALRSHQLLEIKEKARVPVERGVVLYGVMDEIGVLTQNQVFVQYRDLTQDAQPSAHAKPPTKLVRGKVIVGRSPSLHPGDIRVLTAVDAPQLRHLVDVVVFPRTGYRSLPSMMSGGDLDGDVYFVIWDERLFPTREEVDPAKYEAAPMLEIPDPVNQGHLIDWFLNYIVNTNIGPIAHAHVHHADRSKDGVFDPKCIRLAEKHSQAVDFVKTGVPAVFDDDLKVDEMPHFLSASKMPKYKTQKVLGRMFDCMVKAEEELIKGVEPITAYGWKSEWYDEELAVPGFEAFLRDACHVRDEFGARVESLMNQYGVEGEAELWSGHVVAFSRRALHDPGKRVDLQHKLDCALSDIYSDVRQVFWSDVEQDSEDALRKASAWYYCCYNEQFPDHMPVLSFPWVVYDQLCEIKKSHVRTGS